MVKFNLIPINNSMIDFRNRYPGFSTVFNFEEFNPVQIGCYHQIMHNSGNMVVSAPTSSGKTVVF